MRQPPRPPGSPPAKRPSTAQPAPPAPPAAPPDPRSSRSSRSQRAIEEEAPIVLHIPAGESSEIERAEAIRDVMQHAVTMTQAVALAKQMRSWPLRPITLALLAVTSLTLCIYTLVAEPDWAFGPNPGDVAPAKREAHVRFAMVLAAQQLDAVRATTGVLPATLTEIAEEWPGVEYQPTTDSTFELRARGAEGKTVILQSNEDLRAFLGDSRRQLRERRP